MTTWDADERGWFGDFGGRFMPEALIAALDELDGAWQEAMADQAFREEFDAGLGGRVSKLIDYKQRNEAVVADAVREPAGREDVKAAPSVTLVEAMRLAADRDDVARQYAEDFADVIDG